MPDLPPIEVTVHAVERYQQRVAPVDAAQARAAMDSPAVRCAATFGAPYVRLPSGHRLVIRSQHVVTVLPADYASGRLDPRWDHLRD